MCVLSNVLKASKYKYLAVVSENMTHTLEGKKQLFRYISHYRMNNSNRLPIIILLRYRYTGWTGWICPILENYCGNFYLMSVLFFFMHLLSSPVTFYDISSDFWYWEIFFLSQTGDNPKGYPLEIFENDHSVFKKSFQISKCDAKTILKKSLKLT